MLPRSGGKGVGGDRDRFFHQRRGGDPGGAAARPFPGAGAIFLRPQRRAGFPLAVSGGAFPVVLAVRRSRRPNSRGGCHGAFDRLFLGAPASAPGTVLDGSSGLGRFLSEIAIDRGVFFWQRVFFGFLGPAAFAYMVHETARIRSTQSATGILYLGVIFVVYGEFLARYLALAGAGPM